ncbi:hypothetical protein E2C01_007978 [Portunus trituberculatus]|uniref:Uncharacterized protein n=1 Tax=Portunus trituberculatus TaxID=210409 RepID=A0A5B7D515_PORTR|nr:hypothetical protein [Portunus trituberculatus]
MALVARIKKLFALSPRRFSKATEMISRVLKAFSSVNVEMWLISLYIHKRTLKNRVISTIWSILNVVKVRHRSVSDHGGDLVGDEAARSGSASRSASPLACVSCRWCLLAKHYLLCGAYWPNTPLLDTLEKCVQFLTTAIF